MGPKLQYVRKQEKKVGIGTRGADGAMEAE